MQKKHTLPVVLIILDGFGFSPERHGNAIKLADMPCFSQLQLRYPSALLRAAGEDVGLLPGYFGNSQVGHLALGAGRVIQSVLHKMHAAIQDKSFFKQKILVENLKKLVGRTSSLHVMLLLSDGGVHSHIEHMYAVLRLAKLIGLEHVFIHAFLDGRDCPARSAQRYLQELEQYCSQLGLGKLASVHGRFYAMDRDNNWDRTQQTYDVLVGKQVASVFGENWQQVLDYSYRQGVTDEFIPPTLLNGDGAIKQGDGVVFLNFRADRARQLTECFLTSTTCPVPIEDRSVNSSSLAFFITTTRYKKEFIPLNNDVLYEHEPVYNTLLDVVLQHKTLHAYQAYVIAETEKHAHVTYFLKGMRDEYPPEEYREFVPSLKHKNYVKHPAMSAETITKYLLASLQPDPAYFYVANYANADMVGHSGDLAATITACEILDKQLALLYEHIVVKLGATMVITADHGNAEQMIDPVSKQPLTSHTTNDVPFIMVSAQASKQASGKSLDQLTATHSLIHVAPTLLNHMGLPIPVEMEQETIF